MSEEVMAITEQEKEMVDEINKIINIRLPEQHVDRFRGDWKSLLLICEAVVNKIPETLTPEAKNGLYILHKAARLWWELYCSHGPFVAGWLSPEEISDEVIRRAYR